MRDTSAAARRRRSSGTAGASADLCSTESTSTSRPYFLKRPRDWATYMVDTDGKNRYPRDDNWLTDGYGDFVRHFLRAMASDPELAPDNQEHLLRTSSVIRSIVYGKSSIQYEKYDADSEELFKLGSSSPAGIQGATITWDSSSHVLRVHAHDRRVLIGLVR